MLKPLAVWGAGGHASVVADIVRAGGAYEIIGFLDDLNRDSHGRLFCGARVIGGAEQLDTLSRSGVAHIIVAVGDCDARLRLSGDLRQRGFTLATVIHPRAVVSEDAILGTGTVVGACAVANPGARLGDGVILNTCASVDHDCLIQDGAHIGPGVHLGGRVVVGRASHVGIGAVIIDGVQIGSGSVIGAGAVVVTDIPDGVIAYGTPARVIRTRKSA